MKKYMYLIFKFTIIFVALLMCIDRKGFKRCPNNVFKMFYFTTFFTCKFY